MEYHSGGSLPLLGRPRYCPGANANGGYLCETGHCCGETGCCTYYYELWWFWLLWTVLILFSCCCAYRHRRAKLRVQQQQRQREISLLAYHGANSFPSSMLDLSFLASLKLPSYEEVAAQPSTPPPPYSSVFTTPRYPQPPRAADPHLLTQHGPLLHRPLSDGPSSFSSNSSSCSCDSCCPSSPCSSSLSAPITYETDTSHASTPSEAMPLTLDVTMETIAAAASCLEANGARFTSDGAAGTVAVDIEGAEQVRAQELPATDSSFPGQTVTVAVVTRAASSQPSPSSEIALAVAASSPMNTQLEMPPCSPIFSTGSSSTLPSPRLDAIQPPSIKIMRTGSQSGPSTPTANSSGSCGPVEALEALDVSRTFDPTSAPSSPSTPSPDVHRTMAFKADSASLLTPDQDVSSVPADASVTPTQTTVPTNLKKDQEPLLSEATLAPPNLPSIIIPDTIINTPPKPTHLDLTQGTMTAPVSSPLTQHLEPSPRSGLIQSPSSPGSDPSASVAIVATSIVLTLSADDSGPSPGSHESKLLAPLPSDIQASCSTGSGSGSPTLIPDLTCQAPVNCSSSCPAITIESETSFTPSHSPHAVVSPSSPRSPPCHAAPALLLDPLTALHQPDKGGSSSGHASSLSPSPRATQSPPKQTVFSPCVDVFEPGPACWEDGEEEQGDGDKEEDEEDDMGADESQYRHRRLTGDSGIEVCRCRVEEEEEDEEEDEEEEKKNIDMHDSVDCPARSQMSTEDELTPCNPSTSVTSSTPEENGKVIIVMEKV
ncbi:PREDICTED: flocculation protein FLO11-like [Cyprinodon variegatus]|uniref:Si:ch73-290k24.6 n=1 Tax=Cyprinodon variegatus TaxID=28743 RepID=A0A3Q2CL55_CYPVA|nr:PREDICTED: flocculation protein FLO11-like [Cyprinodon variegatus]